MTMSAPIYRKISKTALIYRMRGRWRWTSVRIAELKRLWPHHGASAIARMLGCSRTSVWQQSHRLGLTKIRQAKTPWPPEQVARLKELWPSTSIPLIAVDLGMTRRGVQAKARRLGLPVKGWPMHHRPNGVHTRGERWWPLERKHQLMRLRLEGKTMKEITEAMGVTKGAVAGQIRRLGLGRQHPLSEHPATVERRERDRRRRERVYWQTDLRVDQKTVQNTDRHGWLPANAPKTCQFVYGSPLRFCTNKRAVVAGRVSMYCKEHGITIKPTTRMPTDVMV